MKDHEIVLRVREQFGIADQALLTIGNLSEEWIKLGEPLEKLAEQSGHPLVELERSMEFKEGVAR